MKSIWVRRCTCFRGEGDVWRREWTVVKIFEPKNTSLLPLKPSKVSNVKKLDDKLVLREYKEVSKKAMHWSVEASSETDESEGNRHSYYQTLTTTTYTRWMQGIFGERERSQLFAWTNSGYVYAGQRFCLRRVSISSDDRAARHALSRTLRCDRRLSLASKQDTVSVEHGPSIVPLSGLHCFWSAIMSLSLCT